MSQNRNQQPSQQSKIPEQLQPEVIKAIIEQQGQKIQLELQRIELEKLRLGQNTKLAEKAMENQSDFLKRQPSEERKTFTRIGYVVGGIIIVFLAFMGFLVYTGNKDFADSFLKFLTYLVTSIFSFVVGRKSVPENKSSKNKSDSIEDAEIIED